MPKRPATILSWEERRKRRKQMALAMKQTGDLAAVAERFGVSIATVRIACQLYKVNAIFGSPGPPGNRPFIILGHLINTRDTHASIARKCGVTRQWVSQVAEKARDAGIKIMLPRSTAKQHYHRPSNLARPQKRGA